MTHSLKTVFTQELGQLKADITLVRRLRAYAQRFITKNSDHAEFFGNALIGVHPVRWTPEDTSRWWDTVLLYHGMEIEKKIHSLEKINPNFAVSSDATNLSFIFVLHLLEVSKDLTEKEKSAAKIDTMCIMHYKFVTSILAWYFKYPAQHAIALATYNALNRKFDLKVAGTWNNLIKDRSEHMVSKSISHYQTYVRFDDDTAIVKYVNDIQGRIRETIKNITQVFYSVSEDAKITSTASTMVVDGETIVKDKKRAFNTYSRYIREVISDERSFIRSELIDVIMDVVPAANATRLETVLKFMSRNHDSDKYPDILELVDEALLYSFDYMQTYRLRASDLGELIARLRAIFTASKNTERAILFMREHGDALVTEALSTTATYRVTKIPVSPERTAMLLYVIARALTMKAYS